MSAIAGLGIVTCIFLLGYSILLCLKAEKRETTIAKASIRFSLSFLQWLFIVIMNGLVYKALSLDIIDLNEEADDLRNLDEWDDLVESLKYYDPDLDCDLFKIFAGVAAGCFGNGFIIVFVL